MSQSIDSQGWDRFKNVIRGLYLIKGHKLEGPDGVIKIMETQHGFKKSKAQYEKQFKDWGFKKNRTKRDWEIMNRKIQHRKRIGKESNIYQDGRLMPAEKLRKETSRQGYVTTVEQFRHSLEAPPQTPPGFDIRTPLAQPFIRLAFENLPIFQFQELARPIYAGAIAPSNTSSTSALATLFQSPGQRKDNGIPPNLNSLLPMSAFIEEPRAAGLAIQRVEDVGHVELFNLAAFMISNNFLGDTDSGNLREWLRTHNITSVLEALPSTEGPTAEALVENIFRFAIEDGDISTVKYLLQAGVNPNGHNCFYESYDDLTPLQFALLNGNTEMAIELINAGSTIDEPNTGVTSSALVLAIIGDGMDDERFWWRDNYDSEGCEDSDAGENEADRRYCVDNHIAAQEASDCLSNLISSLINAGAAINYSIDFVEAYSGEDRTYHTPLSAASKHLRKDIVDLLIQHGADVSLEYDWAFSALHECLYTMDNLESGLLEGPLRPLRNRPALRRGSKRLDAVIDVVYSLVKAGANVNEEFYCESYFELPHDYSGPKSYTIFDLGVLTGHIEVVSLLIFAGAQTTLLSVGYAIQFLSFDAINQLLLTGASVRTKVATDIQAHHIESYDIWIKEVALFKAIHLGHVSTIEFLFNDGTFRFEGVLNKATELTKAIENCCSGGHVRTLRLILQNTSKCQFSLSPWFGNALFLAILKGRDDVVDALMSAGASVNSIVSEGQTPLLAAITTKNKSMLERLMGMGAILNPKVPYGTACSEVHGVSGDALISAIEQGDSDVVNYLLEWGADIEALGINSHDQMATDRKAYGITEYVQGRPCHCIRPITAALMDKNSDLVHDLIQRGVKIKNPLDGYSPASKPRITPLSAAIRNWDSEMANFIIREGANIDDPGAINVAISDHDLHWARDILFSRLKHTKSKSTLSIALGKAMTLCSNSDFDIIRLLLSVGADPNMVLRYDIHPTTERYTGLFKKESALDCAVKMDNSLQLVKTLLEAGAKADTYVLFGMQHSPLQSAVKRGKHDIAQILLDYGSNPNSVPMDGYPEKDHRTPLQIAVERKDVEMIKILFQYKVNVNAALIGNGTNGYYWRDVLPRTPLQEASMGGNKEIVELMLDHGADVNSPPVTGDGATALQYAAMYGFLGIAHLLLEHGADVNAPPAKVDGRTALEGAAEHGRVDMVQLLLNAGVSIFGDGQAQYENAISRASEKGHHAIRRMLEKCHGERE